MLLRDVNLSPYTKDIAVRNITCKLKALDDIRFKYKAFGAADKVKKDKSFIGNCDDSPVKTKTNEVSKMGQVNISTDPMERVNAPWLEKLSLVVYHTSFYLFQFGSICLKCLKRMLYYLISLYGME